MKKMVLAAIAATFLSMPAGAAVLTLQGVTANGPGDFTFTYQATLGPDEGLRSGDRFIVYDFAGYIAGSIFAGPDFTLSVQNGSPSALITPGFTDDLSIPNLVFIYTGPDVRNTGGPALALDLPAIGARSTFGGRVADAFFSLTTKNNPAAEANSALYTLGSVGVPFNQVPEPATWAMMLGGFGLLGAAARRRKPGARVAS